MHEFLISWCIQSECLSIKIVTRMVIVQFFSFIFSILWMSIMMAVFEKCSGRIVNWDPLMLFTFPFFLACFFFLSALIIKKFGQSRLRKKQIWSCLFSLSLFVLLSPSIIWSIKTGTCLLRCLLITH